jgi:hypothetical protein
LAKGQVRARLSCELAEAGAGEVMVRLPDIADPGALERMASVISAFRR